MKKEENSSLYRRIQLGRTNRHNRIIKHASEYLFGFKFGEEVSNGFVIFLLVMKFLTSLLIFGQAAYFTATYNAEACVMPLTPNSVSILLAFVLAMLVFLIATAFRSAKMTYHLFVAFFAGALCGEVIKLLHFDCDVVRNSLYVITLIFSGSIIFFFWETGKKEDDRMLGV